MCPKVTEQYRDDKVRMILKEAKLVFIQKGFAETTMTDIVEACRISRGSLYMYFTSTDDIFKALLELDSGDDAETIDTLTISGMRAYDILQAFIESEKAEIADIRNTLIPASYEYFLLKIREGSPSPFLEKRRAQALETLVGIIRYGISNGEFNPVADSEAIANHIMIFLDGLILTALSGVNTDENNPQLDLLLKLIYGMLAVK